MRRPRAASSGASASSSRAHQVSAVDWVGWSVVEAPRHSTRTTPGGFARLCRERPRRPKALRS